MPAIYQTMPAIYLTDMSKCLPRSALSKASQPNHWRTARYESEEVSGTMIVTGGISNAPDVTYPLEMTGWHAIYVGYATAIHGETVATRVRLASDPCFTTIEDRELDGLEVMTLREVFWKYAELTGQDIVFGQHSKGVEPGMAAGIGRPGGVAYVKLEPLSQARIECVRADRADARTRKVIVSNDGGVVGARDATVQEDVLEQVQLYRNSDVGRIDYAVACGDQTQYPSRVGYNLHEINAAEEHTPFARALVENLRTLIGKGIVPHRVAMRHAHSMGMEFYYMFRMALGGAAAPLSQPSRLFAQRPDLRMVDRDATPLPKLSFAFAEVQQHMLDIMEEVIDDEVDGINICWMRGLPVIGYEQPVVDAF